jgi:hypothetical protein
MAFMFYNRCLSFLMAVAKSIFRFNFPIGYQDKTGFHWNQD